MEQVSLQSKVKEAAKLIPRFELEKISIQTKERKKLATPYKAQVEAKILTVREKTKDAAL